MTNDPAREGVQSHLEPRKMTFWASWRAESPPSPAQNRLRVSCLFSVLNLFIFYLTFYDLTNQKLIYISS